jgi:hypothetical protein
MIKRIRRRRIILIVFATSAIAGGVVAFRQAPPTPPSTEIPFGDLDAALAEERGRGWVVDTPPGREGPYRSLHIGEVMPIGSDGTPPFTAKLRWPTRNVVAEEVAVTPQKGFEYMTLMLEVPDGGRTQVVLRRRF